MERKERLEKILKLVHEAEKLKTSLRHGITSIGKRESIADHCWRLSFLVMLCAKEIDQKVNVERCLRMAIIHDIVEVYAGDIHFLQLKDTEVRKLQQQKELSAITQIRKELDADLGHEIYNLWMEFEEQQTLEAKFVRALDKLEGYIQQNEADVSTWTEEEKESVFYYLDEYCSHDSFLTLFKDLIMAEAKEKIMSSQEASLTTDRNLDP